MKTKDLFEHQNELPIEVQSILDRYSLEDNTYEKCEQLESDLKPLGFTFEYGLDAQPFNLRKIH